MKIDDNFLITPIGTFHCSQKFSYDVPRQGNLANHSGYIELNKGHNYEHGTFALDGFERIWIIYIFNQNKNWKPLIMPPRGDQKIGVFASRAPYRPNPIGISCVELDKVVKNKIFIKQHDLLDKTPVIDIKPYIPYADSFPNSNAGWIDNLQETPLWTINYHSLSHVQLQWIENNNKLSIKEFITRELSYNPLNNKRKRITIINHEEAVLAYRTWRIRFTYDQASRTILICNISSGYSMNDLLDLLNDKYEDKKYHIEFNKIFKI